MEETEKTSDRKGRGERGRVGKSILSHPPTPPPTTPHHPQGSGLTLTSLLQQGFEKQKERKEERQKA